MKLFVIGGAGYVGSHFIRHAQRQGHSCIVYDNFSRGHRASLSSDTTVVEGDIIDTDTLQAAMKQHQPDAVLHYAAYALVGESVADPTMYYENNVQGVISMLQAMCRSGVKVPLVFSSSCAVFGTPTSLPMREDDPKSPQSPYGQSKLMAEYVIADVAKAEGFPALALRYFNACGADESAEIGEDHEPESHLIPNAIKAAIESKPMTVFGKDFDTKDGTCVRDYIHVTDLADAHLIACEKMAGSAWEESFCAVHLGSGDGYSNLEILNAIGEVTSKKVPFVFGDRRPGDPAALFTDNSKAKDLLGFVPKHSDLPTIIKTAYAWHKNRPQGYKG